MNNNYAKSNQLQIIQPQPNPQTQRILQQVNKQAEVHNINRYQTQQNAIFVNYQHSDLIKKLLNYSQLNYYQRLSYAKHILSIRQQLIFQSRQLFKQIFKQFIFSIIRDTEQIKRFFIIQLQQLIKKILPSIHQSNIYQQFKQIILPALILLIKSENIDNKQESTQMLVSITPKLKQIDRSQIILKQALILSNDSCQQNKMISIQLLSHLSQCFNQQYCDQFIAKQILILGQNSSIRLKRQVISCLPSLSKIVSQNFFQTNLMQFYFRKCQQNSWAIRKVCVDIIYQLSQKTQNRNLKQKLQNYLFYFLKDQNSIVKITAHKILPNFIATLNPQNSNRSKTSLKLIQMYLQLIDSQVNIQLAKLSNNQILKKISFTFPAVLLALGKNRWKQLYPIYNRLIFSKDKKVRVSLAYSLHEIGKILGAQLSKQYLFSCLDNILKQDYEDIKMGVIQHLSEFVEIFDEQTKQNLIDIFLTLQKDAKKWRIRYLIANQIEKLCKIYNQTTIFKYILPISFKLCSDPVFQVRKIVSQNIWIFLQVFKNNPTFLFVTIQSIKGLAHSGKFNQRQSFLMICKKLWQFKSIFSVQIIPCLQLILKDKIAIVRILLAELVFLLDNELREQQRIRQIFEQLKKDQEMDVRDALIGR